MQPNDHAAVGGHFFAAQTDPATLSNVRTQGRGGLPRADLTPVAGDSLGEKRELLIGGSDRTHEQRRSQAPADRRTPNNECTFLA